MKSFVAGVVAALCATFACVTTSAAASTKPSGSSHAAVVQVGASRGVFAYTGGLDHVNGKVKHAISCRIKLISGKSLPVGYSHNPKSCTSGKFTAHIVITSNQTNTNKTTKWALIASNSTSSSTKYFYVEVEHKPAVKKTTTTTTTSTTTTTVTTAATATSTTSTTVYFPPSPPGTTPPPPPTPTLSFVQGNTANVTTASSGLTNNATTITPTSAGDIIAVGISAYPGVTVSSVSGGGISWQQGESDGPDSVGISDAIFWGQALNTTSFQLLVTFSGDVTSATIAWDEFATTATSPSWSQVASGSVCGTGSTNCQTLTANATTVNYPTLTSTATDQLYFGYAVPGSTPSVTNGGGFTYQETNNGRVLVYSLDAPAPSSPSFTQVTSDPYNSVGVIVSS